MTDSGASGGPIYAGFWIRVWASIIDSMLLLIIVLPLLHMIYGQAVLASDGPLILGPAHVLVSYVLPALAIIAFWVYREATPGKIAIGARIVDARTGEHPHTSQFVIRYIGYFLSSFPLGLGLIWVGIDKRKQGWHDKIAGTVVVRDRGRLVGANSDDGARPSTSSIEEGRWQA
ncbi:hypothetical protein SADO_10869 [Salinisphaera dokdonensis CL-ES53]|uniref:RDD domain-containing protein n=1 Tax=Salinisphaera dokdonensis CL-ES53 TaxID=1304272 RepID=A0ABV2B2W5_9GAMM